VPRNRLYYDTTTDSRAVNTRLHSFHYLLPDISGSPGSWTSPSFHMHFKLYFYIVICMDQIYFIISSTKNCRIQKGVGCGKPVLKATGRLESWLASPNCD
jgi:hypothetical protein